jgi:hypothetical protein
LNVRRNPKTVKTIKLSSPMPGLVIHGKTIDYSSAKMQKAVSSSTRTVFHLAKD